MPIYSLLLLLLGLRSLTTKYISFSTTTFKEEYSVNYFFVLIYKLPGLTYPILFDGSTFGVVQIFLSSIIFLGLTYRQARATLLCIPPKKQHKQQNKNGMGGKQFGVLIVWVDRVTGSSLFLGHVGKGSTKGIRAVGKGVRRGSGG